VLGHIDRCAAIDPHPGKDDDLAKRSFDGRCDPFCRILAAAVFKDSPHCAPPRAAPREDGWLDIIGTPLTEEAKLTERFRRVNFGRMEIDITVDDPKAYTKPWTVRHLGDIMLDTDIIEFICEENNHFTPR